MKNYGLSEANLKDAYLCLPNLKSTSFCLEKMGGTKLVKKNVKSSMSFALMVDHGLREADQCRFFYSASLSEIN